MPRRPRIHLPGLPQHVLQRGVDRQAIFFSDDDYCFYLECLGEYAARRGIGLHAYCLMTNHIHLLLTAPSVEALAGLMQDVGRRYVLHVNRTRQRSGALWQGRYKTSFLQSDRYLLPCMRYVEFNPVRARQVEAPGQYRWSSYAANALGVADMRLTPHDFYLALGKTAQARQEAYRDLCVSAPNEPAWTLIRAATQQGVVAGDELFADDIGRRLGRSVAARPRGRPRRQTAV